MVDVGKREDQLLDRLSDFMHNRDATLAWISLFVENGNLEKEKGDWLATVLRGEDV